MTSEKAQDTQVGGSHYKTLAIQPIAFIHANGLDYFQGNIIKYATRHKAKGGVEDLRKVIHYAQLAIEMQYRASAQETAVEYRVVPLEEAKAIADAWHKTFGGQST